MATAENCTVKTYTKVPLVKGGTEVLYLSQAAAEGVLAPFLQNQYTEYYYTRENRGAIQVKDTIQNVEGANYVSFQNNSHGGKLFFGFIDKLIYINDNTTEIQFTIDPFPTYLGDCKVNDNVFIVRNTPLSDGKGLYLEEDYLPQGAKTQWTTLSVKNFDCKHAFCYYACSQDFPGDEADIVSLNGTKTGIKAYSLLPYKIRDIQTNGGIMIGAYIVPDEIWNGEWELPVVKNLGTLSGNALQHVASKKWNKTKSGLYNSVVLRTSQGSKTYQLESFINPEDIQFGIVGIAFPVPSIYIYPKNYCNLPDNLAEGLMMNSPALPFAASQVYTNAQSLQDASSAIMATIGGTVFGALKGGAVASVPGMVAGAVVGAVPAIANIGLHATMAKFSPPTVGGTGQPALSVNGRMTAQLQVASPTDIELTRIDRYFDYYGYSMNCEIVPNTDDEAFLQTGSDMLLGSEADYELNSRLMNGIKIRKTLKIL